MIDGDLSAVLLFCKHEALDADQEHCRWHAGVSGDVRLNGRRVSPADMRHVSVRNLLCRT